MVLWAWKKELNESALDEAPLRELLRLYRLGSSSSKADEEIADLCRGELVKLQGGGPREHRDLATLHRAFQEGAQ